MTPHRAHPARLRLLPAALLAACLLVTGLAGSAAAAGFVDRAASAFRDGQRVYVDPLAVAELGPDAAGRVRSQVAGAGTPIWIAVLPAQARDETGGDPDRLVPAIANAARQRGTYGIVSGNHLAAGSDVLRRGQAASIARASIRGHSTAEAVLLDFVDRVSAAAKGGSGASGTTGTAKESSGVPAVLIGFLVVLLIGVIATVFLLRRRRERRAREFDNVRQAAMDDLVALGEDIGRLDLDMKMPGVSEEAVADYSHAVDVYGKASAAFDRARTPQDLAQVSAMLEEGRYAMASARARLDGKEPPARRPPCFFDPRHGPSVRDVGWAPPGGAGRPVPACAACAQAVESGLEPQTRQVLVGGRSVPFWNAPGYYAPWYGGYFGGAGGGLLAGLLLGEALSGWGWGGGGYGAGYEQGFEQGQAQGGDFGGGDFGGGDFS